MRATPRALRTTRHKLLLIFPKLRKHVSKMKDVSRQLTAPRRLLNWTVNCPTTEKEKGVPLTESHRKNTYFTRLGVSEIGDPTRERMWNLTKTNELRWWWGGGGPENLSPWLRRCKHRNREYPRPCSRYSETSSIETPFHNSRLSRGEDSNPTTWQ